MKLRKSKYGLYFINNKIQVVGYYAHGNIQIYCLEYMEFGYSVSSSSKEFWI